MIDWNAHEFSSSEVLGLSLYSKQAKFRFMHSSSKKPQHCACLLFVCCCAACSEHPAFFCCVAELWDENQDLANPSSFPVQAGQGTAPQLGEACVSDGEPSIFEIRFHLVLLPLQRSTSACDFWWDGGQFEKHREFFFQRTPDAGRAWGDEWEHGEDNVRTTHVQNANRVENLTNSRD